MAVKVSLSAAGWINCFFGRTNTFLVSVAYLNCTGLVLVIELPKVFKICLIIDRYLLFLIDWYIIFDWLNDRKIYKFEISIFFYQNKIVW